MSSAGRAIMPPRNWRRRRTLRSAGRPPFPIPLPLLLRVRNHLFRQAFFHLVWLVRLNRVPARSPVWAVCHFGFCGGAVQEKAFDTDGTEKKRRNSKFKIRKALTRIDTNCQWRRRQKWGETQMRRTRSRNKALTRINTDFHESAEPDRNP